MKNQRGFSIIELIVAMALLGLVLTSGFALLNVPNVVRGKTMENNNKLKQYEEVYDAFYRVYNQFGTTTANASTIEALNTGPIPIRFNTSTVELTIANDRTYIELGKGNTSLNNYLKFRVIAQPTETASLCKLTSLVSGTTSTWNYSCPGGSYSGFNDAFQNNQINELPIVMIDGRICYVTAINNPANTLRIDSTRNDCPVPSSSAGDYAKMFTLPRLVLFSDDKLFSQAIFESFARPRQRFSGNVYPQN